VGDLRRIPSAVLQADQQTALGSVDQLHHALLVGSLNGMPSAVKVANVRDVSKQPLEK
jgi:hypothetical protein